jgi:hypothetical protein
MVLNPSASSDTSVVNHHVDSTPVGDQTIRYRLKVLLFGDVNVLVTTFATKLVDHGNHFSTTVGVNVANANLPTGPCPAFSNRPAEARRTTCNKNSIAHSYLHLMATKLTKPTKNVFRVLSWG